LLVFLVFTYLYEQSRQPYFRAWQMAWAAYTLHYTLEALGHFEGESATLYFLSSLLLVAMAICLFVSTRLMKEPFQLKWYDTALTLIGIALAYWNLRANMVDGVFGREAIPLPHYRLEIGLAVVLLYCSLHFYLYSHRKNSLAFPSPSGRCSWEPARSTIRFSIPSAGWAISSARFRRCCSPSPW
jgi:hypothetical protein